MPRILSRIADVSLVLVAMALGCHRTSPDELAAAEARFRAIGGN